jgi:hypothetical protein
VNVSSSWKPPFGPRVAYTGTPADDSESRSRSTVRTDTCELIGEIRGGVASSVLEDQDEAQQSTGTHSGHLSFGHVSESCHMVS